MSDTGSPEPLVFICYTLLDCAILTIKVLRKIFSLENLALYESLFLVFLLLDYNENDIHLFGIKTEREKHDNWKNDEITRFEFVKSLRSSSVAPNWHWNFLTCFSFFGVFFATFTIHLFLPNMTLSVEFNGENVHVFYCMWI